MYMYIRNHKWDTSASKHLNHNSVVKTLSEMTESTPSTISKIIEKNKKNIALEDQTMEDKF